MLSTIVAIAAAFAVPTLLVAGWVRFKNRRQRLSKWCGTRPTSAKRRVE